MEKSVRVKFEKIYFLLDNYFKYKNDSFLRKAKFFYLKLSTKQRIQFLDEVETILFYDEDNIISTIYEIKKLLEPDFEKRKGVRGSEKRNKLAIIDLK